MAKNERKANYKTFFVFFFLDWVTLANLGLNFIFSFFLKILKLGVFLFNQKLTRVLFRLVVFVVYKGRFFFVKSFCFCFFLMEFSPIRCYIFSRSVYDDNDNNIKYLYIEIFFCRKKVSSCDNFF